MGGQILHKWLAVAAAVIMIASPGLASGVDKTGAGPFEGRVIKKLIIQLPADQKDAERWRSVSRSLVRIKEGDLFSSAGLVQTLSILSDSGLFSRIHVPDPGMLDDGISVRFELVPYDRVKKICIRGEFPYFEKDIRNIMNIRAGDGFSETKIEEQRQRIAAFYKREGYPETRVNITAEKDRDDGHYVLDIRIEKGNFTRLARVVFEGNQHVAASAFKIKTGEFSAGSLFGRRARFVKKTAEADARQIVQVYRKKGFGDVHVELDIRPLASGDEKEAVFKVSEGPRYRFMFEGNRSFSDRQLKNEIAVYKAGDRNGFGVRKSLRNIKTLYLENGFRDVRIDTVTEEKTEDGVPIRIVTFQVEEGPRYLVTHVVIRGCQGLAEDLVRRQVLSGSRGLLQRPAFSLKKLEADLNAVKVLYLNNGFEDTRVEKEVAMNRPEGAGPGEPVQVAIGILIEEGPQTRIGLVRFTSLAGLKESRALEMISLKPGTPYRAFMVESDENLLKAHISEKGYPHVDIKTAVNRNPEKNLADLEFSCSPGPLVRMGQVIYEGNFRTAPAVLDDAIEQEHHDPLSLTRLMQSRRNISDINALDSVRFRTPGLKEKAPEMDLVVEVHEKAPYYFEFGAGYDTRRNFYIETGAGDHNFLGRNLDIGAAMEVSRIGYRASLSLHDPSFMGSRIASTTRLFTEEKEEFNMDFGTLTDGVSQDFSKNFINDRLTLGLGMSYHSQEKYITEENLDDDPDNPEYRKRGILVFSPSVFYRTTDSFVRPTKGLMLNADMDISKGLDDTLDDFVKYRLEGRWYYSPAEKLTVALRAKYGLIQSYGDSSDVPEDQLFFLGGTASVRGFDENLLRFNADGNAVGGKQMLLGSLEARWNLYQDFELAAFFDTGAVSEAMETAGSDSMRYAVGGGIRYLTPIGPISLLYGHKLDPSSGESPGSFHFSMGYTF